jgi:hypothetical protein
MAMLVGLAARPSAAQTAIDDPDHVILVMLKTAPDHFRPDQAYGGGYGDQLGAGARRRMARAIAARHRLTVITNWPMPMLAIDCFLMRIPATRTAEEVAGEVSHDRGVAWSQPLHSFHGESAPATYDDPLYPAEPAAQMWHLADLHRLSTGKGVTIALIDSKVDARHPDISGQVALARDFTGRTADAPEQHGTGVAGIIAAIGNNHAGIVGVAPGARLLALRACWQQDAARTTCDSFSLAKALQFAIEQKAGVINLSLSGPPDLLIERLVAVGLARGSRIVAAVDSGVAGGGFPAGLPGVVAVADRNVGAMRNPAYIAPGRDIPTTQPGGKWFIVNGSSFATAHVSGLLALLDEPGARGRSAALLPAAGSGQPINACLTLTRAYKLHECLCPGAC